MDLRIGESHQATEDVVVSSFPESGQVLTVSTAPVTVMLEARLARTGRGTAFSARLSTGEVVGVMWYPPGNGSDAQRRATAALLALGSPHPALAWPVGIATSSEVPGWGVINRLIPSQFAPLGSLLAAREQPSFETLARIGAELAGACAALHASGLTYRDFNLATPLADPATGELIIPVTDSLDVLGMPASPGIPAFQAPEVVRGDARPSAASDRHSLAVMLFYLLVHGHPLDNGESADEAEFLGRNPVFVFDPGDPSNRPADGDPMTVWWPIYPVFLRELFTRAFTAGLRLPGERVTERQWQEALLALASHVSECPCGAAVILDQDEPGKPCWDCGTAPETAPAKAS
jgi:DNA-binding helix-hairpin-helix protein with protein kinase domain